MADAFSADVLKVIVGQLCQTIGWHGVQTSSLEIMVDILRRYLLEIGKSSHDYAELFGHTMPNLDDIGLAFQDMGIQVHELEEYIKNVDSVPCVYDIPKYPIPRESHLNFLKPGSREVVTRPVHVHEHLPPMYPEMEEEEYAGKQTPLSIDTSNATGATSPLSSPKANVFKRPGDPISLESPALKRARLMLEEEGRPLREISSVMMTTSGFLSPAREGKLPESRTPLQPSDSRSNSPQPSSYPMVPPEVKGEKKSKKIPFKKVSDIKKIDKENKKKEHRVKESSKGEKVSPTDDSKVKKLVSMKELTKLKALKPGALKMMAHSSIPGPSTSNKPMTVASPKTSPRKSLTASSSKCSKSSSQIKIPKVENTHPSPLPIQQHKITSSPEKIKDSFVDGKLSAEPDKQKLNIFKKISKVKEEKQERFEKIDKPEPYEPPPRDSRESSPGLIIDESEMNSRQREVRMAQIDDCIDAVIQRSMEIVDDPKPVKELKVSSNVALVGETSSSKVENTINEVVTSHRPDSDHDAYGFDDDIFPPGTPSTPKTPELPMPSKQEKTVEHKERKRKKDKSKSKKEFKSKSSKSSGNSKRMKLEIKDSVSPERPKTPEYPEPRDTPLSAPVFPFFPHFPPAPGLIPPPIGHPLFPRFPLHLGKNLPHPAMPNLPLPPPLFMQSRGEEMPEPKEKTPEKPLPPSPQPSTSSAGLKTEKEKIEKPLPSVSNVKEKSGDKKSKEHKKEKKDKDKDKTKKKKDRKDKGKGKEKGDKKKVKVEKRERGKDKTKEKKEKKEKRKDKEREEKPEGVPKITFRLGPASPRPPTPDAQLRKIVIKPVLKKQSHEEGNDNKSHPNPVSDVAFKREPSPELARISALITRPPKPKSSKSNHEKREDSLPQSTPSPLACGPKPMPASATVGPDSRYAQKAKCGGPSVDNDGNKVWICPACGGQDDGSPMIGCDDCDAWYHWVCVGIQVPPDENEDWYCRVCIVKKQEIVVDKKKKSRKRKMLT